MKKVFTLILALAIGFGLKAQCPLTQAVDFTATDCHGTEVHLFDILDGGQAVLIDFFFTTCGPCQQATPKVVESYYAMGCNMHDVFYMEISDRDSDAACQTWCQTYGVEYPTISGAAGGSTICGSSMYNIPAYPTVILIMPDRSIVIQDLWPINNAQTVISALEQHGLQQHDCNAPSYDPQVTITVDQVMETEVTATFTPNADCASYNYLLATESEVQQWLIMMSMELDEYLHTYGFPAEEMLSHTFTELEPDTEYMIYAVPVDPDGNLGEVVQEAVTTTTGGGDIIPDFTGTDIEGNEINLYSILNAGQAVFINFFLFGDEYSETPMSDIVEAYRLYGCNQHDVFFMEITPNGTDANCQAWVERFGVQYPTISRDGGGNDIAQAIPVGFYPTLMLIRPDHTIAMRDIYPPTLEYIIDAMNAEGYEQHECPMTGELVMSTDTIYIDNQGCYIVPGEITITNMNSEAVQILEYTSDEFTLQCHEGDDPYSGDDIAGLFIAPSESIHVFVFAYPSEQNTTVFGTMRLITTIGEYVITIVYEEHVGVEESQTSIFSLFPNPANESVTLKGENLGTVRVYNALGQKVDEFEANGNELRINTAGYSNGVYVVKTNEKALRFVVKH